MKWIHNNNNKIKNKKIKKVLSGSNVRDKKEITQSHLLPHTVSSNPQLDSRIIRETTNMIHAFKR